MKKRDTVIIGTLILVLVALNLVNYLRRENLKRNMALVVEKVDVQISVNRADSSELEELPGIGPVMAQRIITYRQKHGGFGKITDLKNVKGISDKLLTKMLPYIKL
ncbi:MAG TPA: helix-hairpin-helix domain-containing protein [bacterium]